MIYEPFSVVAVPFPFTDYLNDKKRPALVINSETHQAHSGHVTLCMITSAHHHSWIDDHPIIDKNSPTTFITDRAKPWLKLASIS